MKEKNRKPIKNRRAGYFRLMDGLLLLLILLCGIFAGRAAWENHRQKLQDEEIRRLAQQQEEQRRREWEQESREAEQAEEESRRAGAQAYVSPIDFEALRAVNPDTVAWLRIPGTDIDYPVVQTGDNEKYLNTDFEGNRSSAGAIFVDCDSDDDLLGLHTLLYGHHMKNGSMFAQLEKFKDETFFEKNREILLYLPDRELHLRTIAAVYGDADGEKRRTAFDSQEMFDQYIDNMTKGCGFRELPPKGSRGLYSFVTCSYEFNDARTIVYAVREEELAGAGAGKPGTQGKVPADLEKNPGKY